MSTLHVVGIMNGTSLDGVDFVLTRVHRKKNQISIEYIDHKEFSFPKKMRDRLLAAARHELKVDELTEVHFDLGRFYANKMRPLWKKIKIDLIGLHGQTVYHHGQVATLQIGEPSFLALEKQVPVVCQFRPADIAAGGQGAPLAPYFHQIAFGQPGARIAVHNLGGISNFTLLDGQAFVAGYDTGPANLALDTWIQKNTKGRLKFDASGKRARQGRVNSKILAQAMKHPFFKKKAPKSCGREEFGIHWLESLFSKTPGISLEDSLATLTEITALSIAREYQRLGAHFPEEIILCGGGSKNLFLQERLSELLPLIQISTSEEKGWPSQAIEGGAFALLAAARFWRIKLDHQKSTGARHPILLGQIVDLGFD